MRRLEQMARGESGRLFLKNPIDNPEMSCYINNIDNHY